MTKPAERPPRSSKRPAKKASSARQSVAPPRRRSATLAPDDDTRFAEVVDLIEAARNRAYQAVNVELVSLYWQLGQHISQKIASAEWGDGIVDELAAVLARRYAGLRGFTRRNLFRMRQFYEAYRDQERVSPLVTQLPWTHHLIILSQAKPEETREFYILAAIKERWTKRELERQIQSGALLRSVAVTKRASAALVRTHPTAIDELKNAYNLEFLALPDDHSEADLVFFHRGLACLVAFELKVGKFAPEHLGQLSFYVEALDRDVKKPHEHPSIGVLLCASKDDEVVEYALARTTSPTLVAEYQTMLPPKAVLRRKLHELYAQLASGTDADAREAADAAPDTSVQPSARRKRASVTASGARAKAKGKRS